MVWIKGLLWNSVVLDVVVGGGNGYSVVRYSCGREQAIPRYRSWHYVLAGMSKVRDEARNRSESKGPLRSDRCDD